MKKRILLLIAILTITLFGNIFFKQQRKIYLKKAAVIECLTNYEAEDVCGYTVNEINQFENATEFDRTYLVCIYKTDDDIDVYIGGGCGYYSNTFLGHIAKFLGARYDYYVFDMDEIYIKDLIED